jgi:hypothetical protein
MAHTVITAARILASGVAIEAHNLEDILARYARSFPANQITHVPHL